MRNAPHFACHGEADWDDILNSSLSMSDGRLTVRELSAYLGFKGTRLVTLSACETGITDFRNLPSANVGMNAVLREAGVGCVLSSSWPVSDAAAFLIMKKFYAGYIRDGLKPILALAQAQCWLRDLDEEEVRAELGRLPETIGGEPGRPFSNPYYWAAFTLTGL
jgi:CHAT domain-containing protein